MVSPEHVIPGNEYVPPSTEGKEPILDEHQRSWMEPLLRVAAVVLSLASGFAITCLSLSNIDLKGWGFLVALLLGGICASLFRSWWAILAVPLALGIGEVLAWYLNPALVTIDPRFYTDKEVFRFVFDAVVNIPGIAILGICFGSYLGVLWKQKAKAANT
jgi:hypothetical protein